MPSSQTYRTASIVDSFTDEYADIVPVSDSQTIAGLNAAGPWYPVSERKSLPWWMFHILIAMPFLYVCYPLTVKRFVSTARAKKRKAFADARKKIKQCMSTDEKKLYAIFNECLAICFGDTVVDESICKAVESRMVLSGSSEKECADWNDFYCQITRAAYGASVEGKKNELCRMAEEWLNRLEKII
jgi:hypothetical protein